MGNFPIFEWDCKGTSDPSLSSWPCTPMDPHPQTFPFTDITSCRLSTVLPCVNLPFMLTPDGPRDIYVLRCPFLWTDSLFMYIVVSLLLFIHCRTTLFTYPHYICIHIYTPCPSSDLHSFLFGYPASLIGSACSCT